MVGKSGPSFCQGLHTKNGLGLLLAHGHGPVGLAKPYLIFYPLQFLPLACSNFSRLRMSLFSFFKTCWVFECKFVAVEDVFEDWVSGICLGISACELLER